MKSPAASFSPVAKWLSADLSALSDTALLPERHLPQVLRITMFITGIAILLFLLWAGVTRISEVARARGDVVPDGYLQTVQHFEGGIVDRIMVNEGQLVRRGDVLMVLSDVDTSRDLREVVIRQIQLGLQAERLRAFLDNRKPDFASVRGARAAQIADQQRMLRDMMAARSNDASVVSLQIAQRNQNYQTLKTRRTALEQTVALAREELTALQTLLQKGLASRLRVIEKQKEVSNLTGELEQVGHSMTEASQSIGEYRQRLASLKVSQRDTVSRQLESVEAELSQNAELLAKQHNRQDRLQVIAPVEGLVKGLEINTQGAVIRPGQTLMQIVPLNAPLVVEAKISPRDVGHIAVGKPVQIKIHAYDYTRYGAVQGVLEFISATTFVDQDQQSYYRGRVKLHQNFIGSHPGRNVILPGMTVDAEIVTGRKSVLEYLLKPIANATSTAFSER